MPRNRMHFERVPVEVVKKMVTAGAHAANDRVTSRSARQRGPYNHSHQAFEIEYSWQVPYKHALVELNRKMLPERIAAAESAMFHRLRALEGNADHPAERRAIADAQRALHVLKRDGQS